MNNSIPPVEIAFNIGYKEHPELYPRQVKRLRKLIRELVRRGMEPKLQAIEINGSSNAEVIDRITDQIRSQVEYLWEKQLISFFGDSAGGTFLSAAQRDIKKGEESIPMVIGPGGTLNNAAYALGTGNLNVVADIASGMTPHNEIELLVREAIITTFDRYGKKMEEQRAPWACSVGTGIGGTIIHEWENRPRTRHPLLNVILSTLKVIADTLRNKNGAEIIRGNSITTLRNLGFFKFGDEYNAPDKDGFFQQSFTSKFGFEALSRVAVFSAIGHVTAINSWLWQNLPDEETVSRSDFWKLIAEVKPQHVTTPIYRVDWREPFIHLDGYPTDLELKEGEYAEIELITTPDSIPVATAYDNAA